jgi:Protein of unknown function (DUF3072)
MAVQSLIAPTADWLFSASPATGAETNLPWMKPDDVPPDVPPAALTPEKDPDEWVTKDEPMTGPQRSYLQTLCREAGEEFDQNWTKAEASRSCRLHLQHPLHNNRGHRRLSHE